MLSNVLKAHSFNVLKSLTRSAINYPFSVAQCEDLKVKYNEEQVKRKKLHNQFLKMINPSSI